ncbi:hypothetical protein P167DRAFT_97458 [Morchella conica CCBAS932]|uniref:Uncharacterized protein n=1 Tax=Morchella conica CCBAS932 TaxID=1392247 RepID=A0A3N4L720_9PEZI|nr:hypothetical protein P167DRAFT_97458 [Morchella conica CCBAS932]
MIRVGFVTFHEHYFHSPLFIFPLGSKALYIYIYIYIFFPSSPEGWAYFPGENICFVLYLHLVFSFQFISFRGYMRTSIFIIYSVLKGSFFSSLWGQP